MAVPSNPRLSDVCTEFQAPSTTPLSAFLRGGSYVPNVAANNNVPTSLPISLSQLAGAVRYVPMSVSAPNVNGDTGGQTGGTIGQSTATVSGGQSPYTYAWTNTGGSSFSINNASSATASFTRAGKPPAGSVSGNYRCTVTDATNATASADIVVTDNRSTN